LVRTKAKVGLTAKLASLVEESQQRVNQKDHTLLADQRKHNAHQHLRRRRVQKELVGRKKRGQRNG